uniref:Uncharacterized protein n=1 Tax=Anguilla anguilla TaxID=7936 RepID=A0A0E9QQP0_ANGAN
MHSYSALVSYAVNYKSTYTVQTRLLSKD